ncbi:MAG: substrate-binding domain-containing protein [Caulobacteraceae bacterium]|nr:substrate-binding domain-containing protein [Caulobacteraceae bacterium]
MIGASALVVAAVGIAGSAGAMVTTQSYGGGSSLIAPYLRQAEDCYGNPTDLVFKGADLHTPTTLTVPFFQFNGTPPRDCSVAGDRVDTSFQLNYISTGSGTGIKGLYSHDAAAFWGDTVPPGNNGTAYPSVDYAAGETSLGATDVTVYNSGGVEQGITFTATPGPGQYPIPQPKFGNLIQVPLLITPVAIAYDSVYKKVRQGDGSVTRYHFKIKKARANGSGGLVLDAATYCGIFNGQITNWNDPALKALNSGKSLKDLGDPDPFNVPITMVGRFDSSGTSSVWTRHLAAICPSVISGNQYADSTSTMPATLQGPHYLKANPNFPFTDTPGKYTLADGSDGVAKYIQFDPANDPGPSAGDTVIQGRMGYLGPDYVLPAVLDTGTNTYGLNTASILRVVGAKPIAPTAGAASLSYKATIVPPTGGNQSDPSKWVQAASKTADIAIPSNPKAYPIDGTSNYLGYTCYADADVTAKQVAFLNWFENDPTVTDATKGLLGKAGFAPMPGTWNKAITDTFLVPTGSTMSLNLNIKQAGTGPASGTGSQCKAITPGA